MSRGWKQRAARADGDGKRDYQWTYNTNVFVLDTGQISDNFVFWSSTDPSGALAAGNWRLHRLFWAMTYGLRRSAGWASGVLGLGLARADPQLTGAQMSVTSTEHADRSWVYRELYPVFSRADDELEEQMLPLGGSNTRIALGTDNTSTSAPALQGVRGDWQLRGGLGTNIDNDVELRFVASWDRHAHAGLTHGAFLSIGMSIIALFSTE